MMRTTPHSRPFSARSMASLLPVCLLLCSAVQAQTPANPPPAQPASATAAAKQAPEQTMQHIVVEDASTRIDEVRIGSETKSIDVHPKNGMPGYQVAPASGERTWKVLGF